MSDILSVIYDDMNEYSFHCKKFKQIPQYTKDAYGNDLLDCYGSHAAELKERHLKSILVDHCDSRKNYSN